MAKPYPTHFLSEERRKSGNNFTCVVCSERWLESEMRFQDGIESDRRCPNCYEENGGTVARDEDRARAAEEAARLSADMEIPPTYPGWFDATGDVCAISAFSSEPLRLTAGGASASLTISGTGFESGDEIEYGHAGITDASAASITSTQVTLSVQASGAVPVGLYSLTYNDITYRNVFDVRA